VIFAKVIGVYMVFGTGAGLGATVSCTTKAGQALALQRFR